MLARLFAELKRRNVVRVAGVYVVTAWALFQVAKTVFETLSFPDWASPLVLVLLALGLPIALIISWAFERAPDGTVVRTQPAEGEVATKFSRIDGLLLGAIAVVLAVSVAQIAGWGGRGGGLGGTPEKSVAVLPFAHFNAQKDAEYFADGLTEEVINSLAQVSDLKVAGRTSAFYFKGKNEDIREIGRKLGVAHVVEGSVRQSGDRLRVTAQLISVKDGFHLWSKTYDRKMDDAFAIQTEIADAVADALRTKLETDDDGRRAKRDPDAYQLELKARAHLRLWGYEDLVAARAAYERLTVMEPNNAAAYAGYAQATMQLTQGHLALDFGSATRLSQAAIDKALKIDPRSFDAYLAKAVLARILSVRVGGPRYDREEEMALKRALALRPRDPEALTFYAIYLANVGQTKAAIATAEKALAVDPLNRVSQMILATTLRREGRFGEAEQRYREIIELFPSFDEPRQYLGTMLVARGRLDQAEPWLKSVVDGGEDPGTAVLLAALYVNLGLPEDADAVLDAVQREPAASIARTIRMAADGDYRGALAFSEKQAKTDDDPFWNGVIVLTGTYLGEDEKALAVFKAMAPELFTPAPEVSLSDLDYPLYASHLLNGTGDRAQARRVLNALLAASAPKPGVYQPIDWMIVRSKAYAELGETDKAIAELEAATKAGWRTPFDSEDFIWIDQNPSTENIRQDARFKNILAQVKGDLAQQRANVLAARR